MLSDLLFRLRAFFRRKSMEAELDEELHAHVAYQVEKYIQSGLTREEAARRARLEFGGLDQMKEECRDSWGVTLIEALLRDVRYGLRQLRRNPGFTAVAVLTLALGIGGNVAVFSLLDTVLLRPLPYSHPDRLYMFFPVEAKSQRAMVASSYPNFQDWHEQSHAFQAMAAFHGESFNLTGATEPERLDGLSITPGLFALLGIPPLLGREFSSNDNPHVVLLTYELWHRRFGGDAGIIGKSIHLEGRTYTVLGVLPPHFHFPPDRWGSAPEVLVPVIPNPERGWNYLRVIGRLVPGVSEQQARTEMKGIAARLAQAYPNTNRDQGIALDQLSQAAVSDVRQTVWVLLGAVAFVLLIACTNVANLLLSQGATREHEIAIRTAVGATRSRIVRQLLTESLLLAGMGGALGVALAYWTLPLVASAVPQHTSFFTRVHDAGLELNSTVFIFTVLLSVLSCALFGLLPAWRTTKPARISGASLRTGRIRGALIALEVALSFVLLAGAGLMMESLVRLLEVDVGFRTERLLTMDVNLAGEKYSPAEKQAAFYGQVLQRLESLPSVLSVGAIVELPLTRSETRNSFEIPGPHPRQGLAGYHAVSPNYFHTLGIPLLSGRELLTADSARSPLVGVVNRSMAQKYWPDENPVGKTIIAVRIFVQSTAKGSSIQFKPQELEIVGVVGDVRQLGLDALPDPELFMPYTQWPSNEMALVLRTASEPFSLIPVVKKEIWRVDPDQPVTDIKTMDELVSTEAAGRRFVLQLIGVFASIAVVLAAVGIFGVASFWMHQRTHEIGIRMALGAGGRQIVWLVVRQNAKWILVGITAGVASALALTRLLAAYLYAVRPTDPLTFVAVSLLLLAEGLLAVHIPARRATKVDPLVALRYE
ncbi:MAG: ABC transporter permease [Terriglobia bacterium]|jgi:putative ABC transport system permease protein